MSENKPAMRRWTLTLDIDKSDRYRKVSAAYYTVDKDSQLVEFKDSEHRVVLAVPAQRVLSIEAADEAEAATNIVVEVSPKLSDEQISAAVNRDVMRSRS